MRRMATRIVPAPPATTAHGIAVEAQVLASRGKQTALDPTVRELIILRVPVLNRAEYEYEAHVPYARQAGMSEGKIAAVKGTERVDFTDTERAVLDYTDALTREVQVDDAVFERV